MKPKLLDLESIQKEVLKDKKLQEQYIDDEVLPINRAIYKTVCVIKKRIKHNLKGFEKDLKNQKKEVDGEITKDNFDVSFGIIAGLNRAEFLIYKWFYNVLAVDNDD